MLITIAQACSHYAESLAEFGADMDDAIALSEGWGDYTDSLCKEGALTGLQYHYCPAYGDTMPDDDLESDIEYVLQEMGVTYSCKRIDARRDRLMSDMSRHWLCSFDRGTHGGFCVEFSQGDAHTQAPTEYDVLGSLMSDLTDETEFTETEFEYWCDVFGYESDSREAETIYRACMEITKSVRDTFSASEIDDLREMLSEAGY